MKVEEILQFVWEEFVYGGHLLSLGAVSIVFTAAVLLEVKITWDFLAIIYLWTRSVYLFYQFDDFKSDILTNFQRTKHIKKYVKYIPLIIFLSNLIIIAIAIYFNKVHALIFGFLLFLFGLCYSLFLKKITKNIIAFKNFCASLMGVSLLLFLIVYYPPSFFNMSLFLLMIFVFLRWFVNTSFLDLKDVENDKKEKLLTLPIVFKKEKMFNTLNLINVLSVAPIFFGFYLKLFPLFSMTLLFIIPYSFYYLNKIKTEKTNSFLNYVFVDGEFILWSVFILFGKFLL
ncbi:MAG: UbiA family prenyltransferase [Candidatus Pacebacteria bacterium]|nr:UbiA family prenyltransferase [Candidatus Paceibacterota bacterium]